jgi:NCAIR mutase (PurE)-related protein
MKKKRSKQTFVDLQFAKVDLSRAARCGQSEVIYGLGKPPEKILKIARELKKSGQSILITRTDRSVFRKVQNELKGSKFHEEAGIISWHPNGKKIERLNAKIAVCAAGTVDVPVAEEAVVTAEFYGAPVDRFYDVGVAGLHRLLAHHKALVRADVIVVVAGMEGALPSVVAGLVSSPVIAVPTAKGYGADFRGVTPLLAMLNSCASGITVVNINNGFNAGFTAARIALALHQRSKTAR